MNQKLFKKGIKWIGVLIIAHIVSMIIFGIAFSGSFAYMSEELPMRAAVFVLLYDIVFYVLFVVLLSKIEMSYLEYRKSMKEAIKAKTFSTVNYFKTVLLKEHLVKLGIFMAFQLPFVIFFSIWGLSLKLPIMFEQFYYLDAGCYILTNSAIVGWILNTILFEVVHALVTILFVFLTKREIEKDIIN